MNKVTFSFLMVGILFLLGCFKEPIELQSSGGTYEYAFTLKRLSIYDTVMTASQISEKYKFVHGATNEFRRGYSCSFFVNDQLTLNLFLIKRKTYDYGGTNNNLVNYTDSDIHGNGFTRENFMTNYDSGDAFIQILDFPFPGWNRFLKTDE